MEIHDPFQIFLLRRRDIIVIGDYIHVQTLELFSNSVHDFPRLVYLIEDTAGSSNLQSMAGTDDNLLSHMLSSKAQRPSVLDHSTATSLANLRQRSTMPRPVKIIVGQRFG